MRKAHDVAALVAVLGITPSESDQPRSVGLTVRGDDRVGTGRRPLKHLGPLLLEPKPVAAVVFDVADRISGRPLTASNASVRHVDEPLTKLFPAGVTHRAGQDAETLKIRGGDD